MLGAADMDRAERFWSAALGYTLREKEADGSWRVLAPAPPGDGAELALADSEGNRFCIVDLSHEPS